VFSEELDASRDTSDSMAATGMVRSGSDARRVR
jgi:hypothetical protein